MSSFSELLKKVRPNKNNRYRVILLCFFAATTFWFLNAMNKQHTTTLNYDISFIYDDNKYVEVEDLPQVVSINVNGLGWNLLKINLGIKTSPLKIPLENPSEIKKIASSSLSSLISDQLNDLQLNYVLTDTLYLHLDERINKSVHLVMDTASINFDEGFYLNSRPVIIPDTVVMTGPKGVLNALGDTVKLKFDQNVVDKPFQGNLSIPVPKHISAVEPSYVQVEFDVIRLVQKSIDVPIQLTNNDRGDSLQLFPPTIRLNYQVANDSTASISPEDFGVVADLKKMEKDSIIRPELITYPAYIRTWRLDSVNVRVVNNE